MTLEEALSGRSRQRNRAVAEVFNQMGLIEAWGNGLKSIRRSAREYGLPEPEFIEMPETFRVNLFRKILLKTTDTDIDKASAEHRHSISEASVEHRQNIGETLAEHRQNIGETSVEHRQSVGEESIEYRSANRIGLNAVQQQMIQLLTEDSRMTGAALAEQVGISKRNIEANIKKLKDSGILVRHGSSKGGYWEVVK